MPLPTVPVVQPPTTVGGSNNSTNNNQNSGSSTPNNNGGNTIAPINPGTNNGSNNNGGTFYGGLIGPYNTAQNLGLPGVTNYLGGLIQDLGNRDGFSNSIMDIYNTFGNTMNQMMGDRNSFYSALDQDMLGRLSELQNQYNASYGPNGEMRNRINNLYGGYGNYLVNKAAADRALASGLADQYGLSDNARRIAENDAGLAGLNEALQLFDNQTQALDNVNRVFNELTTNAFGQYKGIQDDYLKSLVDSNFGVQTELAQGLMNLLTNNELMKQQGALGGVGGGSTEDLLRQLQEQMGKEQEGPLYPTEDLLSLINNINSNPSGFSLAQGPYKGSLYQVRENSTGKLNPISGDIFKDLIDAGLNIIN